MRHDETWKLKTEPRHNIRISRLSQDWDIKHHVLRQSMSQWTMSVDTSETWSTISDMTRSWATSQRRLCIAVNTTHSSQDYFSSSSSNTAVVGIITISNWQPPTADFTTMNCLSTSNTWFLEPTTQKASWSVQPSVHSSWQNVIGHAQPHHLPLKLPLCMWICIPI